MSRILISDKLTTCWLGDNGLKEYKWRTDKGSKTKSKDSESASERITHELKSNVKIYFPTRQTIERSKGGKAVSQR